MMRQGYLPAYLMNMGRVDYPGMIRRAAEGDPSWSVKNVITSQLDFLRADMLEGAVEAANDGSLKKN